MAAKPTDLARWATSGGGILIPTSGKKDVGFAARERPAPGYLDYLHNLAYQWHAYVDEMSMQMNVLGANLQGGGWKFDNGYYIHSIVNGTQRERTYGPTVFFNVSTADGAVALNAAGRPLFDAGATPGTLAACIPLPAGSIVTGVSLINKRGAGTIGFKVYDHDVAADSTTQKGDSMTIGAGTSLVSTAVTNFPSTTIASGHELYVEVDANDTSNKFHGITVTYVEPGLDSDATLTGIATITIPVIAGMKVGSLNMRVYGTATSDLTVWLTKVSNAEAEAALVSAGTSNNIGAAWKTVTFSFTQDVIDVGDVLNLELQASEAGIRVGNVWLTA